MSVSKIVFLVERDSVYILCTMRVVIWTTK